MAAFQALRRAAAGHLQRGVFRHARQQQQVLAAVESSVRSGGGDACRTGLPALPFVSRQVSTAKESRRDPDGGIISILRAELDHERKTYSQPKEVTRGPPAPWTITDKKGHADIILRRSYGQEDIAVTCVYQADSYEDEDGRGEDIADSEDDDEQAAGGASCVNMTITVNKGADNPTLEISAASYGTQISIEHVYFWEDKDAREAIYEGPNFLQLDEEVQQQFENYIKARGVNRDLAGYLFTVLADKEQRNYMGWLQKVEGFLRQ